MDRESPKKRRFSGTGRFAITVATVLVLVTLLFLLAAVLFNSDPDGHRVRRWLSEGRYWLFAWRLMIYTALCWLWFFVVRPQVLKKSSAESLRRLEWIACAFILISELAAWRSVLA